MILNRDLVLVLVSVLVGLFMMIIFDLNDSVLVIFIICCLFKFSFLSKVLVLCFIFKCVSSWFVLWCILFYRMCLNGEVILWLRKIFFVIVSCGIRLSFWWIMLMFVSCEFCGFLKLIGWFWYLMLFVFLL